MRSTECPLVHYVIGNMLIHGLISHRFEYLFSMHVGAVSCKVFVLFDYMCIQLFIV